MFGKLSYKTTTEREKKMRTFKNMTPAEQDMVRVLVANKNSLGKGLSYTEHEIAKLFKMNKATISAIKANITRR